MLTMTFCTSLTPLCWSSGAVGQRLQPVPQFPIIEPVRGVGEGHDLPQ
jgi:hypothetical protein